MSEMAAATQEILDWVSEATETPVDEIALDKPLKDIGLDSLDAAHLVATIESIVQEELPETAIQQATCLNDIFGMMREKLDGGTAA